MRTQLAARRAALENILGSEQIAIVSAYAPKLQKEYRVLRASADFCYLTDLLEVLEQGWLVLRGGAAPVLFLPAADTHHTVWEGPGHDFAQISERTGIKDIRSFADRWNFLEKYLSGVAALCIDADSDTQFATAMRDFAGQNGVAVKDLTSMLQPMRLVKDEEELARIQTSVELAITAHSSIWAGLEPGLSEQFIAAEFSYALAMVECFQQAYPAIVAGGDQANTLHHTPNGYEVRVQDWLLVDAGAMYLGYCSDLTRTVPVNRQFSGPWCAVYELVLAAQQAAINAVLPGQKWGAVEEAAQQVLARGLIDLGICQGSVEAVMQDGSLRKLYPHRIGHSLGLDVHDVAALRADTVLEPGMVVTIEPGLYLRKDNFDIAEQWRGLGVRIEDNIVVTDQKPLNLSEELPSAVQDLRAVL